MSQLLLVEIKKILGRKKALVLLLLITLVSILFSIYPIQSETYPIVKSDKSVIFLRGKEALKEKKEAGEIWNGELNEKKIIDVFNRYHTTIETYGENVLETRPDIYFKDIYPLLPILTRVQETFADSKSGGIPKELSAISPEEASGFYEKRINRLDDLIKNDLYPTSKTISDSINRRRKELEKPLVYQSGFAENVIDYLSILITVLALIFVILFAQVYASDYQTNSVEIINRTKRYNAQLVSARFLAMVLITIVFYLFAGFIFFSLTIPFYGLDTLSLSFQFNTSAMSIFSFNVGYAQFFIYFVGLMTIISMNTFCLFVSCVSKSVRQTVFICMIVILLPSLLFPMIQNTDGGQVQMILYWLLHLLPSFGIGLMNSFTLSLSDLVFLEIPFKSIWSPIFISLIPFIEIPIFYLLTKRHVLKINS